MDEFNEDYGMCCGLQEARECAREYHERKRYREQRLLKWTCIILSILVILLVIVVVIFV